MKHLDRLAFRLRSSAPRLLTVASLLFASAAPAADGSAGRTVDQYDVGAQGSKAGAARTLVLAPEQVVRSVVTDFTHYESFITHFKAAKVVGRVGDKTDVYLQVPLLHGAIKLWAIVRFDPPKKQGEDLIIAGKMVKGNMKRLDATWRVHRKDDNSTELRLELLVVPDMPVPESLVISELRGAAAKAVLGTRNEAERRIAR